MEEISIITATLNRPSLEGTCKSVDSQTFTNWHHYVIGDGVKPTIYHHTQRTTIGFSRAIGAEEPTIDMKLGTPNPILRWALKHLELGKYVCFLDDDNIYHPQFLEKMINALLTNKSGIAICMLQDFRTNNRSFYRIDEDPVGPPFDAYPQIGHCDNSSFITYSCFAKVIGFPTASKNEEAIQDFIFIKTIADQYGWVRVPEPLVLYGVAPNFPPDRK